MKWWKFTPTTLVGLLTLLTVPWLTSCGDQGAQSSKAPPLLWEVNGHGAKAYLFGTMHVGDPRVTTLHAAVEKAFTSIDAFYTEAGESTPADGAKFATAGILPEGMSLKKVLPPDLWAELDSYLLSRHFDNSKEYEAYRPWFAGLTLAQIDAIPLLKNGQALDFALTARAKSLGKEVGALETVEEQIAALSVGSLQDQIHMLEITLQHLREEQASGESSVQKLLKVYLDGDTDALLAYAMEETDMNDPVQVRAWEAITTVRNERMVERIHAKLSEANGRTYMFAVGSLHYVGPDSIIVGLQALGYEVSRINGDL